MEPEDFLKERAAIFQKLIVALDHHLKALGKENIPLDDVETKTWILAAYEEPEISALNERYNELEYARFMKLYGATRVPDHLFSSFIGLKEAIIRLSVPPILSVLKEYRTIGRQEQLE